MSKTERITKTNHFTKEQYTVLTEAILEEYGFLNHKICKFKGFKLMGYWVKNGVCLFYPKPVSKDWQDSFLTGYAEMRQGNIFAVGFRWINSEEDLIRIYEGTTGKQITEKI